MEGDKAKTFYDVTLIVVDINFGITSNPELFKKYDVKSDSLVLFKKVTPCSYSTTIVIGRQTTIGRYFNSSQ